MQASESLADWLRHPGIVVAPGVYDALTAYLAAQAGFQALYLSGAAVAYSRLGRPDVGLVTGTEMADTLRLITERVSLPIIADADTGYGNAINVQRTVRLYERAGAAAIQMEDQTFPKRCGHLADKTIIPADEMAGKIKAAVDARASAQTLIIARTDAVAVEGMESALERAAIYEEAGADVLFVEAPRSLKDLMVIPARFGDRIPLMANMVEGGRTPALSASDLAALGFKLVIFPGGIVRALMRTAQDYFESLHRYGSSDPFRDRMHDFEGLNTVLGTADLFSEAKSYESYDPGHPKFRRA